jgi:hypothetical protein
LIGSPLLTVRTHFAAACGTSTVETFGNTFRATAATQLDALGGITAITSFGRRFRSAAHAGAGDDAGTTLARLWTARSTPVDSY